MDYVGYMYDGAEFITPDFINRLAELRKKYVSFGIGVYTDELFEKIYKRKAVKSYAERERLAAAFKDVDFVFRVSSLDNVNIESSPKKDKEDENPKPYHVGYAPGTYDLLHEGHLEHLDLCRKMCDILVVGVKSDNNVWETKKKYPYQYQDLRLEVIKNLSVVDEAFIVTTRDKRVANQKVQELIKEPIDVVFLGSDCVGQENDQNPDKIPFVYTERPMEVMKTRSSTYYRKQLTEFMRINYIK